MTWRSDSSQLISGKWITSAYQSHGITGAELRSLTGTGGSGAGVLYNDWDTGDDASEFRYQILSYPASGTLVANEDGTFTFTAPDGTYSWTYQLYVNGVAVGTAATVSMTIGSSSFVATITLDDFAVNGSFSGGIASNFTAAIVIDDFTVTGAFANGAVSAISGNITLSDFDLTSTLSAGIATVISASLVMDDFVTTGSFSGGTSSVVSGNIDLDGFTVTTSFYSAAPAVFSGNLQMADFNPSANFYSVGSGGLDPTTPLGRVRLKIGDYSDLPILPDAVIYATLADHENNVNRTSQICAQYILGILTSRTHKRIAQLETWSGEQFTNYVQFLKLTVLNPNLTTIAPVPYAGTGTEDTPIKDFVDAWKAGYNGGSIVIPPQGPGKVIEYAF